MYFFPLASNMPPLPLLCTLYNSLMILSGELVGWALCAACEKRLPKIATRGINEKLIVLIVSVPRKFAILRKHITAWACAAARLLRVGSMLVSLGAACSVTVKIETVSVQVLNGELPQTPGLFLQWLHDLRT